MPESDFLTLLKKIGLQYDVCGERGTNRLMPIARQKSIVDLSKSEKCYEIYGDKDEKIHMAKYYRAFTGANKNIIYIENTFAYTGP